MADTGDFHLTEEQQELEKKWVADRKRRHTFKWLVERTKVAPNPILFKAITKLEAMEKHQMCGGPREGTPRNGLPWLCEIADQTGDSDLIEAAILLKDLHSDGADRQNHDGRFKWLVDRAKVAPYPVLFKAVTKLEAMGKHQICGGAREGTRRNGFSWLCEIADQTEDPDLRDAALLLKDLNLDGRDWQKHDRRLKRAFWGDRDGDAFREHFSYEKKNIKLELGAEKKTRERTVREGCTDRLAVAKVVAAIGVKAASWPAAMKAGYSLRKKTEPVEEPSTGWLLIQVPAGRRVRDPNQNHKVLEPELSIGFATLYSGTAESPMTTLY